MKTIICLLLLGYDPVGWGLPYGNLISTDTAKLVMETAVQALIVLLDYGHPIRTAESAAAAGIATLEGNIPLPSVLADDTDAQGFNVFRRLLGTVEAPDQLNFIFRGIVRLLNNVHQSENTYLPYSVTRISIEQELLILFWKCLEEMPKFMPYILKHCDITEIFVPICYFMLEGRKDPSKVGLMYLCTFTLLKLSGERSFGVALNKPFQQHLPVDIPLFNGNHADLLVVVLHKLIVSGLEKLSALYSCFLTIICNISPYCKSFGTVAAIKLVNLLQLFVSPRFLYASESNHVYVGMLLETLNNIVQYHYEGNGHVIYAIIRRKELFEGIANLTLPAAIKVARDIMNTTTTTVSANNNSSSSGAAKKTAASVVKKTATAGGRLLSGLHNPPTSNDIDVEHGTSGGSVDNTAAALCVEATPTELISTAAVQRTVSQTGDIVDNRKATTTTTTAASATTVTQNGHSNNSSSSSTTSSVDDDANTNNNNTASMSQRFVPTEAWLQAVKADLPLNTIIRLLKHLVPQVEELSASSIGADERMVIDFLRTTTMVGLLPVPHPIVIRKYQPNRYTCLWFTAFQWGVIFMHNQTVPLFDGRKVKLFIVQTVS